MNVQIKEALKRTLAGAVVAALVVLSPGQECWAAISSIPSERSVAPIGAAGVALVAPVAGSAALDVSSLAPLNAAASAPSAAAIQPVVAWSINIPQGASLDQASLNRLELPSAAPAAGTSAVPATSSAKTPAAASKALEAMTRKVEDLRGKAFILFGAENFGRPFLLSEPVRAARALGLRIIVVDKEEKRPSADVLPPADFIAAPIASHDPASMREVSETVSRFVQDNGLTVAGGPHSILNPFVVLAAMTRDALRAAGHKILGDGYDAVHTANEKRASGELIARNAPDLAIPSETINGPQDVAASFRRFTAKYPSRKVVLKPKTGAGKVGVRVNIETAEQAVAAYQSITDDLKKLAKTNESLAELHAVDNDPGIFMQLQLEGPEVDVEFVLGQENGLAIVVGNPRPEQPHQQEKGFTVPSQLAPEAREELVRVGLAYLKAGELRYGNHHVEMIYDRDLGPRLVEFNTRMGGGHLYLLVQKIFAGYSLIEQGMRAVLGLRVEMPRTQSHAVLISRYVLPEYSGDIVTIEGLEELEKTPDLSVHWTKSKLAGGKIIAPQDGYADDDYGYVTAAGSDYKQTAKAAQDALKRVKITVATADGLKTQTADFSHGVDDEVVGAPHPSLLARVKAGLRGKIDEINSLPASFKWHYIPGWTTAAIGQEIQAVALPIFTASLYDLPTALMITGAGYILRIAGAWTGASLTGRFNPTTVNNAALVFMAVAGAAIGVAGLGLITIPSGWIVGLLLANSVINGVSYGVNRGVVENIVPRMILGKAFADKLNLALNCAFSVVEVSCIVAAFLAQPLLHAVGGGSMMLLSSGLIGASTYFYGRIKYAEKETAAEAAAVDRADGNLSRWEYVPFIFFKSLHFMMYGVMATILGILHPTADAASNTIGVYDLGSFLLSVMAALTLLPKWLDRKSATVLGAAAAVAFLWSAAMLPVLPVTMALGGLLGGLITIATNEWMPYYSQHLSSDKYRNLSKWLMTWSTAALLPVFAVVSAIRIAPESIGAAISMPTVLVGLAAAVTIAAGVMLYGAFGTKRAASRQAEKKS